MSSDLSISECFHCFLMISSKPKEPSHAKPAVIDLISDSDGIAESDGMTHPVPPAIPDIEFAEPSAPIRPSNGSKECNQSNGPSHSDHGHTALTTPSVFRSAKSMKMCYLCDGKGHFVRDCPRGKVLQCFYCGKNDHCHQNR